MIFRRSKQEERSDRHEQHPASAAPDAVLRDEFGLYHLWYFERRLAQELARAARIDSTFSLAVWQLRLLPGESLDAEITRKCASLIVESLRAYDLATRIDGERLGALLFDANYNAAATVAFRIKGELQLRVRSAGKWQAGVSTFQRDGVDGDSLIRAALRRLEEDARAA